MGSPTSLIRSGLSQELDAAAMILELYSGFNAKDKSCAILHLKTPGCFEYEAHLLGEWEGERQESPLRISNQALPGAFLGLQMPSCWIVNLSKQSTFIVKLWESAFCFCYAHFRVNNRLSILKITAELQLSL